MHNAIGNDFRRVSLRLFEAIGTPRALTACLLIKHGEWDQLVSLRCVPEHYLTPEDYFRDQVVSSFLQKLKGLPTSIDLKDAALKSFIAAEKQCCLTNLRLRPFIDNGLLDPSDEAIHLCIDGIRKDIRDLLGRLPEDLGVRHGPGATFHDRGKAISVIHKMSSRPTMTSSFVPLLPLWAGTAWCRGLIESHSDRSHPLTVRGNRFTTVPKDATKDRGIAIEPSLNIVYQLVVGQRFKRSLSRWLIDLKEGQSRHRALARDASRKGHLATIDLSSASDTVSRDLIRLLFPDEWWSLLSSLRSTMTRVNGKWHWLEKFSSMGNGFTFELETIVFASIVRACARNRCVSLTTSNFGVYGDDIICPSEIVSDVLACLRWFGFTPNPRKTFHPALPSGMFRESCGGDFFLGESVRPHFVKDVPASPAEWIALANGLKRVQDQFSGLGSDLDLSSVWKACIDCVPYPIRTFYGPAELGDLVINTTDESKWNFATRSSIRYFRVLRPFGRLHDYAPYRAGPLLAAALYGVSSRGFSIRGEIVGYRNGRSPYS